MSAAVSALFDRSIAVIPAAWRKPVGLWLLFFAALAFPLIHDDDADIDAVANAAAMPRESVMTGPSNPVLRSSA